MIDECSSSPNLRLHLNPPPSDEQWYAIIIELPRLRGRAQMYDNFDIMCCLSDSHGMLIMILESRRSLEGWGFDPRLGLINYFSEVKALTNIHRSFNELRYSGNKQQMVYLHLHPCAQWRIVTRACFWTHGSFCLHGKAYLRHHFICCFNTPQTDWPPCFFDWFFYSKLLLF